MIYNRILVTLGPFTKVTGPTVSYQYDQKQILVISGVALPEYYEVDICNEGDTTTVTMVGTADGVLIPNAFLRTGRKVKAYVVLQGQDPGAVETRYEITLPVYVRPAREDIDPTAAEQQQIDALVDALNDGVSRAETAATEAEEALEEIGDAVERAESAATRAEEAVEDVEEYATRAETAAGHAESSARDAAASAGVATDKADEAAGFSRSSAESAAEASGYSDAAGQSAGDASDAALRAARYADDAGAAAGAAENYAGEAQTSAGQAANSATAAGQSATNAAGSATTATNQAGIATTKAGEAAQSATAASEAQTAAETAQGKAEDAQEAAEAAQQAAEQAAQDVIDKAPVIINSASGEIASFSDGADSMPIKSLVASIEPVQDLHGYDSPWPGGGNVNKFSGAWPSDVIGVYAGWSTGATTQCSLALFDKGNNADISGVYFGLTITGTEAPSTWCIDNGNVLNTFIATGEGTGGVMLRTYVSVYPPTEEALNKVLNRFNVMAIADSIAQPSAFSPYSNICPISGHTGLTVTRTGKNVFNKANTTHLYCDGSGRLYNNTDMTSIYVELKAGKTYTFSQKLQGSFSRYALVDEVAQSALQYEPTSRTGAYTVDVPFTISSSSSSAHKYLICTIYRASADTGKTFDDFADTCQLEEGSTASTYESYTGTTIPITFPETIYGGSDEVIGGKLKANMAKIVLDGTQKIVLANWRPTSSGVGWIYSYSVTNHKLYEETQLPSLLSNKLPTVTYNAIYAPIVGITSFFDTTYGIVVWMNDPTLTSVAAINNYLSANPIEVVYELAESVEYTLDGEELTTLYGQNNVWTDVGEVSVEYPADTKLYIDNKIATAIANALNA